MAKYLDKSGVTYLWNKIKGLFTDQSLNTENKTYAGAINEVNSLAGTAKSTADTANSNATSAKTAVDGLAENVSTSKITFAAPWGDSVVEVDKTNNNGINLSYSGTLALPVHGIATPHNDNDAVNKKYVDDNLPNMEMYAKIGATNGGINGIGFTTLFIGEYGNYAYLEKSEIIEDPNEPTGESITGIQMRGAGWQKRRFTGITHTINDTDAANKSYVDTKVATKQDKLTSGTNIKTVNGQSLLGSGDISTIININPGTSSITGNNISIIQNAVVGTVTAYIVYYDGDRSYTLCGGSQSSYMQFVAFDIGKMYILHLPYTISGTGAPNDPMILNINHNSKTIQEISISGGSGDVTAAGNNTFTGINTFSGTETFDGAPQFNSGLTVVDATNNDRYKIYGDNYGLVVQNIDDNNSDIRFRGILTPEQNNDAANKSYVDTQINTALGTVLTQLQNI